MYIVVFFLCYYKIVMRFTVTMWFFIKVYRKMLRCLIFFYKIRNSINSKKPRPCPLWLRARMYPQRVFPVKACDATHRNIVNVYPTCTFTQQYRLSSSALHWNAETNEKKLAPLNVSLNICFWNTCTDKNARNLSHLHRSEEIW